MKGYSRPPLRVLLAPPPAGLYQLNYRTCCSCYR